MNPHHLSNEILIDLFENLNEWFYINGACYGPSDNTGWTTDSVESFAYLPSEITKLCTLLGDFRTSIPNPDPSQGFLTLLGGKVYPEFHNSVVDLFHDIKREILHRTGGVTPNFLLTVYVPWKLVDHDITGWQTVEDTPP